MVRDNTQEKSESFCLFPGKAEVVANLASLIKTQEIVEGLTTVLRRRAIMSNGALPPQ